MRDRLVRSLLNATLASACAGDPAGGTGGSTDETTGATTGTSGTATDPTGSADTGTSGTGTGGYIPCTSSGCEPGDVGCACDDGACANGATCEEQRCVIVTGDMVTVPEGPFCMGCDPEVDDACVGDELPAHEIWLSAYEIDRTEVTQQAYQACVDSGSCPLPDEEGACINRWDPVALADHPVVCVQWEWALAFCESVGKSVPTEAQWEKAARGPRAFPYPWGEDEPTCELTNFGPPDAECVDATVPVGSYPGGASPYGAQDMAGNVWERVSDWYWPDYYGRSPFEDPQGPSGGSARVLRGGSFTSVAKFQRASARDGSRAPWVTARNVGFRCARPLGG